MARDFLSSLRFFRKLDKKENCRKETIANGWGQTRCGQREWEEFYRRRWQHDRVVRSTHGVNCTGSCSWNVYVKDGIVAWETQKVDYPGCGPDMPDYEPRGCPRGATFSWYLYSPLRVKYPYARSILLEMWREAMAKEGDPVTAWASIVEDPVRARKYKEARGKGGFVRISWAEAATLIAASLVHTIRQHGPDRIFGFTPIPAMSMVAYASGARFLSLIGAPMISFYDWYCDLPPASPQIWGEQTDVPESADWYEAGYMIVWGTNLPMTRTPDAHFFTEARYRGTKVVSVSPDYSESTKFADTWLPAKAGTDGALAMAMTHVILKEYYLDRPSAYFTSYAKSFTDLPFAVLLRKEGNDHLFHRFLRATDLGLELAQGEWKTVVFDSSKDRFVVPNGSIGFRWGEQARWNLNLEDSVRGTAVDPALSFAGREDEWVQVQFPFFESQGPGVRTGVVPVKAIGQGEGKILVTTVFDLMAAHLGIDRGQGGDVARDYSDPVPYTPAWQEKITGVSQKDVIQVAREFAENAEKTRGKSMIFLGAGSNHWYHSDTIYRAILNLTTLCGCQGVNGGGWAHYVGQEKVRPLAAWSTIAFGLDWNRPARLQNGTSFYYFATDQWRYETLDPASMSPPLKGKKFDREIADCNVIAARLGWLPFYPQFDANPVNLCEEAKRRGAASPEEIVSGITKQLKTGELHFSIEDVDHPKNFPRVLFLWRANVLGASGKGHEYFLKHLLGTSHAVLNDETRSRKPKEIIWRDPAPEGKLDLLVTLELRMSTSAVYADVVLPAASWYEMHDLSTTDLHPFIHPFNPAVDPLWESKTSWDQFKAIAEEFSRLAATHLGVKKDVVASPLMHDSPGEISQPMGKVKDWKKGEAEAVPGKTMPNFSILTRDYPNIYNMMTSLGPLVGKAGIGAKGLSWNAAEEYEELKKKLGTVTAPGVTQGMPALESSKQVAEAILTLAPETNGQVAVRAWKEMEKRTGLKLSDLSEDRRGEKFTFEDLNAAPRKIITSPVWSGLESESRRYSPFVINIEKKVPFRTLSGRAHFYLDHEWMLSSGEGLPIFRPPLGLKEMGSAEVRREADNKELLLNYLTPHSKWSIHSTYSDTLTMLTLFRGGEAIWINDEDAQGLEVKDNDWLECFNVNGVVMAKAVVSHRIPRGKAFMYHAQERLISTPGSKISGQRGGTHNSVTRILMKPTQMIGGYAQTSYGFNYYGPTGAQRDEIIIVRKAGEVEWYED